MLPRIPYLSHAFQLAFGLLFEQTDERSCVGKPERLSLDISLAHLDARGDCLENVNQQRVAGLDECSICGRDEEVILSQFDSKAVSCHRHFFVFILNLIQSLAAVLVDFTLNLAALLLICDSNRDRVEAYFGCASAA